MLRHGFFTLAVGSLMLAGCSVTNSADDPIAPGSGGSGGSGGSAQCAEDCSTLDDDCSQGVCVDGSCTTQPANDGNSCDDGLFCTTDDACQDGTCAGEDRVCPAEAACSTGQCDDDTDACVIVSADEGAECDDGNRCTDAGTCMDGMCEMGADLCGLLDSECSTGVCDMMVGCSAMPINEGQGCDATNPCGTSSCQSGTCTVITPMNEGLACDDGLFCTLGDTCMAGACSPGTGAVCAESNSCGTWACDEATTTCTLTPMNEGQSCNDQNACTPDALSTCQSGTCDVPNGPHTYLFEDFGDNSAGWLLGPEWQIGPAMTSPPANLNPDPGIDHTPTADSGVAGVVIGGNYNTTAGLHPFQYLTSPPMNVPAGETAVLGFWRWLNSDYTPYVQNVIEVWDGTAWVTVWSSGSPPAIEDSAWTYISHDLTPWVNPEMRVRFGFNIGSGGVFDASGWNIDDVLVASMSCP
jgi:hypothetical protein